MGRGPATGSGGVPGRRRYRGGRKIRWSTGEREQGEKLQKFLEQDRRVGM